MVSRTSCPNSFWQRSEEKQLDNFRLLVRKVQDLPKPQVVPPKLPSDKAEAAAAERDRARDPFQEEGRPKASKVSRRQMDVSQRSADDHMSEEELPEEHDHEEHKKTPAFEKS